MYGFKNMAKSHPFPIYAYYFPQDETDQGRLIRNKKYQLPPLENEYSIVQNMKPLYAESVTYCLGDKNTTVWRDSDPTAVRQQVELANSYGITGFIVCSYAGRQNGKTVSELWNVVDLLTNRDNYKVSVGCMFCLKLSRNRVPVPPDKLYIEPGRLLDVSSGTAQAIIDRTAGVWNSPNYIHIDGKPYISLYGLLSYPGLSVSKKQFFIENIRSYAKKKYHTDIFLVGVATCTNDMLILADGYDFDQTTTYQGLADLNPLSIFPGLEKDTHSPAPQIQSHEDQLSLQVKRWSVMKKLGVNNFIPGAVVGLNASYRGVSNVDLETVQDLYPYTPIIIGSTPDLFLQYLKKIHEYLLSTNIQNSHRMINFLSWNEIGESGSVIPRVNKDGSIDYSWLEAIKSFSDWTNI